MNGWMDGWMGGWMNGWMDAEYYDLLKENMLNSEHDTIASE